MNDCFKFDCIDEQTPICEDNFYKWLCLPENNPRINDYKSGDRSIITTYLKSLGFVVGKDRITEKQLEILQCVAEHWWRAEPINSEVINLENEISLAQKGDTGAFYLAGKGKVKISPNLRQILEKAKGIYAISPRYYYLEVVGDKLYLKYQTIIGSRVVCRIIK